MTTGRPLRLVNGNGEMAQSHDPFAGDNAGGYSKDKFYTRSTDAKGNSETKYMKVSPVILGAVGELVASRKIAAYRTEADFFRDAAVHRLMDINEKIKDGRLLDTVNRTVMLSRVADRQTELTELSMLIDQHRESMQMCYEQKDKPLLRELLEDAEADIEQLRPTYQARLRNLIVEFREKYKSLEDHSDDE